MHAFSSGVPGMHAVMDPYERVASVWRESSAASGQKRKLCRARRSSDGYNRAALFFFIACILVGLSGLFTIMTLHRMYPSAPSLAPALLDSTPSAAQPTVKPATFARTTVISTVLPTTTTTTTTTTVTVTKSAAVMKTGLPPQIPISSTLHVADAQLPLVKITKPTLTADAQISAASNDRNLSFDSSNIASTAAAQLPVTTSKAANAISLSLQPQFSDLNSDLLPFLEAAAAASITTASVAPAASTDANELLVQQQLEQQRHTLASDALSHVSLTSWLDNVERLLQLSAPSTVNSTTSTSGPTRGITAMPEPSDARTLAAMPTTVQVLQQLMAAARACTVSTTSNSSDINTSGASSDAQQDSAAELLSTRALLSSIFSQLEREVRASSARITEHKSILPVFMTVRRVTTATVIMCLTRHPTLLGNTDALLRSHHPNAVVTTTVSVTNVTVSNTVSSTSTVSTLTTSSATEGLARSLLIGEKPRGAGIGSNISSGDALVREEQSAGMLRSSLWSLLALLQQMHESSRASRGIVEYMHVSKAGGTSMCNVAKENKCRNPNLNLEMNCLMPEIAADLPRWTRLDQVPKGILHDGLRNSGFITDCRTAPPAALSCAARHQLITTRKFDFAANENAVHGGQPGFAYQPNTEASNGVCEQFINVLTLREPARHLISLIGEVMKTHTKILQEAPKYSRTRSYIRSPIALPRDLAFWQSFAPAVLDNYYTRMLVGRRGSCMALGSITPSDVDAALSNILSFDAVMLLGIDDTNDVLFKQALKWNTTLRGSQVRVSSKGVTFEALGFEETKQPAFYDMVAASRVHDVKVFRFATAIHHLDAVFFAAVGRLDARAALPTLNIAPLSPAPPRDTGIMASVIAARHEAVAQQIKARQMMESRRSGAAGLFSRAEMVWPSGQHCGFN